MMYILAIYIDEPCLLTCPTWGQNWFFPCVVYNCSGKWAHKKFTTGYHTNPDRERRDETRRQTNSLTHSLSLSFLSAIHNRQQQKHLVRERRQTDRKIGQFRLVLAQHWRQQKWQIFFLIFLLHSTSSSCFLSYFLSFFPSLFQSKERAIIFHSSKSAFFQFSSKALASISKIPFS